MLTTKTMLLLTGVALFGAAGVAGAQDLDRGVRLDTAQLESVAAGRQDRSQPPTSGAYNISSSGQISRAGVSDCVDSVCAAGASNVASIKIAGNESGNNPRNSNIALVRQSARATVNGCYDSSCLAYASNVDDTKIAGNGNINITRQIARATVTGARR